MLLQEGLMKRNKDELVAIANYFKIDNVAKLKKRELAELIASQYCTEDVLRNRFSCLTEEEIRLFRKECEGQVPLKDDEVFCAIRLEDYLIGYFDGYILYIYDDIREVFLRYDDASFREDNRRKGWLIKCIHFFINYYGIAPVEVVYEMYRSQIAEPIDKMLEAFYEMPSDLTATSIFYAQDVGIEEPKQDSPLFTEIGLMVHLPLIEEKKVASVLLEQQDKEFTIPSVETINDLELHGYEISSIDYRNLEFFFTRILGMCKRSAYLRCIGVWNDFYHHKSVIDIYEEFDTEDLFLQLRWELKRLLRNAGEVTRMLENRGN